MTEVGEMGGMGTEWLMVRLPSERVRIAVWLEGRVEVGRDMSERGARVVEYRTG